MTRIDFKDDDGNIKVSGDIPSAWDEMTAQQVQFVFREYGRCLSGEISPMMLSLEIMYNFLGLGRTPGEGAAKSSKICQNLYILCEQTLGFLFIEGDKDEVPRLSFNCVMNPLPAVRSGIARTLLTGPASLLQDLTFGEFRHASAALNAFFKSGDISELNECIAFLYRRRSMKPNRAGRKVKPYSQDGISKDAELVASIPDWQKNLIMMWFSACIGYLQTGKLTLNGEEVDLSKLFSGDGSGKGPSFTWNDILVQIARDNTIGNIDRVDEEPLFSIIAIMWTNHKEAVRYEKSSSKPAKS